MFNYFYHQILRKTIISFGTLFNNITIQKKDDNDNTFSIVKVPIAYGPTQKFLARLEQQANLNRSVEIQLPRMSFEFNGISYDPQRKLTTTTTFSSKNDEDGATVRKAYMPVPYNMNFELSIYTKINDDMLQIIEQVLPYFQPEFTLTVDLVEEIGEKRDIPIIINNIKMSDDYEGDFSKRRSLIYTINFTAKTYLFGPVSDASKDIVKKVAIGYVAGNRGSVERDVTYSVRPTATKSYTDNVITTLAENVSDNETEITLASSSGISKKSIITVSDESMLVESIDGNNVNVVRGYAGTTIANHVTGTSVQLVVEADNALIEPGDEFGFDSEFI